MTLWQCDSVIVTICNVTMLHTSHVLYCPSGSPHPTAVITLCCLSTVILSLTGQGDSLSHSSWGGTHSGCLTEADWDQGQDWLVLSVLRAHAQTSLLCGRHPPSNNQPVSGPLHSTLSSHFTTHYTELVFSQHQTARDTTVFTITDYWPPSYSPYQVIITHNVITSSNHSSNLI